MPKIPDEKNQLQQRYFNIVSRLAGELKPRQFTMTFDASEVPANLKSIVPYMKIATQHEDRDPVVTYWARLYALQTGMKNEKSGEERNYLVKLVTWLETFKKEHHDNEAISNEVAAQAHLENWALKLFLFADENDRASNFSMNVIQSFYTAGLLYDLLTTFGELTDEAAQNRKYAKWKAAYIHNCLKNGQTPIPGPKEENEEDVSAPPKPVDDVGSLEDNSESVENPEQEENKDEAEPDVEPPAGEPEPEPEATEPEAGPEPSEDIEESSDPAPSNDDPEAQPTPPPSNNAFGFPPVPNAQSNPAPFNTPSYPNLPGMPASPSPAASPMPKHKPPADYSTHHQTGNVIINAEQMNKTQKYIKWAGSAINYDDIPTAIENLQKALHLLTTGQDS